MKNERGDITTALTYIMRIIKYYEQYKTNKFYNSDGLDKFILRHKLSKLTKENR